MKAEGMSEDSIMMDFKKPTKLSRFTWNGEEEVEMSPWDSIRYHKQIAQAGLMSMEPSTEISKHGLEVSTGSIISMTT